MDWSKGYSASYYATQVDKNTWRSLQRFEIIDGSISRQDSGLRHSADIECMRYQGGEQWVRIYLNASQNGESVNVPLFTGLSSSPSDSINGSIIKNKVQLYSVLKPAEDVLLDRGYYVASGSSGANVIRNLLKVTPAPVVIVGESPTLSSHIVAEGGESHLTMVEKVLKAMNWRLNITGEGQIVLSEKAKNPIKSLDPMDSDMIEPELEKTYDWYECPNVFRAVSGDVSATARDDSVSSPLSTVNRGREVWKEDSSVELKVGETIGDYAMRRLKEEQSVATTVTYDRRFDPDITVTDIVRLHYPRQGIDGNFRVVSQSIDLGYSARTSEEVVSV